MSRWADAGGNETNMQADYVIVGAGSAGCVLANRLTEDPGTRVVLIEAGGRDWNPLIHIPAGFMKLLDHPTLTWGYKAEADPGTAGRAIVYPRGRVLGGSSSINGLIYIRGQPEDFDHWAQLGNRGWGWDDVLPYFRTAENWQGEASELHGKGGFLTTSPMSERPAACQAIIEAAQEIGLEYRADVNNLPPGAGDSIGWCQQTRGGRRRASAARTYLRPASKRPNLEVVTNALVHRVIFDGTRTIGVEFSRYGGPGNPIGRADAAFEVILAAGAVGSPHLLQLSGVGDPEVLAEAGIPVHHALPGVGKNFQDHYIARMSCEVKDIETLNERGRGLSFANEVRRYFTSGTGMLTYSASLCAASVKVLEESATPMCSASSRRRATSRASSASSTTSPASPAVRGRCGPCRAAMCWCVRPIRASRRRSTRAISPMTPIGARWSAGSNFCAACSRRRRWRNTSSPKRCQGPACRPMTSCWTTHGRTARPSITRAAAA